MKNDMETRLWKRHDLVHRLLTDDALITFIAAPAGYGKTSFAIELVEALKQRSRWLSLTARDRDHIFLASRVVNLCHQSDGHGNPIAPPSTPEDIIRFVHEAVAAISSETVLVIEDFHEISEASKSESLVNELVRALRENGIRTVVTSRSTNGLRLANLTIRGDVSRVEASDLSLTENQIANLFKNHYSLSLTANQTAEIFRATRGWMICLCLIRQVLSRNEYAAWDALIPRFSGHDVLSDFLAEEVLEAMPSKTAYELRIAAIVDPLDPSILAESGLLDQRAINRVFETGLVTVVPGSDMKCIHPLLRKQLEDRLASLVSEGQLKEMYYKVAAAHKQRGNQIESLKYLKMAACWDELSRTLIELVDPLSASGQYETITHWVQQLPESAKSSQIHLVHAMACFKAAEYESGVSAASAAAKVAGAEGDRSIRAKAEVLTSKIIQVMGRRSESLEALQRAVEFSADLETRDRVELELSRAYALLAGGDYLEIAQAIRRLVRELRDDPDEWSKARVQTFRAYFASVDGRPNRCARLFAGLESYFRGRDYENQVMCILAVVSEEVVCDPKPERLMEFLHQLSGLDPTPGIKIGFDVALVTVLLALGRIAEAREIIDPLMTRHDWKDSEAAAKEALIMLSRCLRVQGDSDDAAYYLRGASEIPALLDHAGILQEFEEAYAVLHGNPVAAIRKFRLLEHEATVRHIRFVLPMIWFAEASVELGSGGSDRVNELLRNSMRMFRRGDRALWLRLEAQADPSPLTFCLREDIETEFVARILIRAGRPAAQCIAASLDEWSDDAKIRGLHVLGEIADTSTLAAVRRQLRENHGAVRDAAREALAKIPSPEGLGEKYMLTPREVDVLRELAKGLTNKQIASALFLSEKTVKTYVNRIFYKLGVTQRVQAAVYYKDNFTDANC